MMRFTYKSNWQDIAHGFRDMSAIMGHAATGAMDDVNQYVKEKGRAVIAAAGFSRKWQNALRADRYPKTGFSLRPAVFVHHNIRYAGVFQRGAQISGSPLLWLPIEGTLPQRIGGRRMTPKVYEETIGPLHSVNNPGRPPFLAAYMRGSSGGRVTLSRLRAGAALAKLGVRARRGEFGGQGVVSVPVFIGLNSVQLRARFDLDKVFAAARQQIPDFYLRHLGPAKQTRRR